MSNIEGVVEVANTTRVVLLLIILLLITSSNPLQSSANRVNLLPFEDEKLGRNSHAYLPVSGVPSIQMKENFVKEISTTFDSTFHLESDNVSTQFHLFFCNFITRMRFEERVFHQFYIGMRF